MMKIIEDKRRLTIIQTLLHELGYCSIEEFQRGNGLADDGLFGEKTYRAFYAELLDPISVDFVGHYYKESFSKNQIVIHHTAGWDNARGVFEWWKNDKVKHVATAVAINDQGVLYKGFDEDYWAHHIGAKNEHFAQVGAVNINTSLNQHSVGIEICNWGQLNKEGEKFFNYLGKEVKVDVYEIDYRGCKYFEKYTDNEIDTLRKWILLMSIRYNIPLYYEEDRLWEVNRFALNGSAGIFTHGSYRSDKVDVCPQPKLVKMLKELERFE